MKLPFITLTIFFASFCTITSASRLEPTQLEMVLITYRNGVLSKQGQPLADPELRTASNYFILRSLKARIGDIEALETASAEREDSDMSVERVKTFLKRIADSMPLEIMDENAIQVIIDISKMVDITPSLKIVQGILQFTLNEHELKRTEIQLKAIIDNAIKKEQVGIKRNNYPAPILREMLKSRTLPPKNWMLQYDVLLNAGKYVLYDSVLETIKALESIIARNAADPELSDLSSVLELKTPLSNFKLIFPDQSVLFSQALEDHRTMNTVTVLLEFLKQWANKTDPVAIYDELMEMLRYHDERTLRYKALAFYRRKRTPQVYQHRILKYLPAGDMSIKSILKNGILPNLNVFMAKKDSLGKAFIYFLHGLAADGPQIWIIQNLIEKMMDTVGFTRAIQEAIIRVNDLVGIFQFATNDVALVEYFDPRLREDFPVESVIAVYKQILEDAEKSLNFGKVIEQLLLVEALIQTWAKGIVKFDRIQEEIISELKVISSIDIDDAIVDQQKYFVDDLTAMSKFLSREGDMLRLVASVQTSLNNIYNAFWVVNLGTGIKVRLTRFDKSLYDLIKRFSEWSSSADVPSDMEKIDSTVAELLTIWFMWKHDTDVISESGDGIADHDY